MRDAADELIFDKTKLANCFVMTKDKDHVDLLQRNGPPPSVLLITSGNTNSVALRTILERPLTSAFELINKGMGRRAISGR